VGDTVAAALGLLAFVLAAGALAVAVLALRRTAADAQRRARRPVPPDLDAMARVVSDLRTESSRALRHLAVVRYDAFGDMGGHLSWSLAIVDDEGDGVVLTAIHGRSDTRTYAKNVTDWTSGAQLSPEETEAVALARQ